METPSDILPVSPDTSVTETNDPFTLLAQMSAGYALSRCLHCVAAAGIADLIDDEPRSSVELATASETHPDALLRILRLLSAHGVFRVDHNNRVSHSSASRMLRSDHPQSVLSLVKMFGLPINWQVYEHLDHSLKSGMPATEKVVPGGLWTYYASHAEENSIFNAAMTAKAQGHLFGIMNSYDFSSFNTIADIAGGRGHLLNGILSATPGAKGILFDLPHVVAEARELASERLALLGGDFFKDPLPSADAYLLMEIIHDWPDEESVAILKAIRRAAPDNARLLVIEQIMPETQGPHWAKTLDILMLALVGGRQRTQQEYTRLLERAGFTFVCEIDTMVGVSILEAHT